MRPKPSFSVQWYGTREHHAAALTVASSPYNMMSADDCYHQENDENNVEINRRRSAHGSAAPKSAIETFSRPALATTSVFSLPKASFDDGLDFDSSDDDAAITLAPNMSEADRRKERRTRQLKTALSRGPSFTKGKRRDDVHVQQGPGEASEESITIATTKSEHDLAIARAEEQDDLMARAARASKGHDRPRPNDVEFYRSIALTPPAMRQQPGLGARATPAGTPGVGPDSQWFADQMKELYGNRLEPTHSKCTMPRCVVS